jgi:uncharacterized protein (DUF433 family)
LVGDREDDVPEPDKDKAAEVYPGLVVDSRIMHGVPVIKGTRIPARLIVGQLAGGESIEGVMDAYALTEEQVRAALGYAAERLGAETVYAARPIGTKSGKT